MSNTGPESPVRAPRRPCPSRAGADGEVVVSEAEDTGDDADEVAEEDVESVVAEVGPPGRGDENRGEEGEKGEDEEVHGRRGSLSPGGQGNSLRRAVLKRTGAVLRMLMGTVVGHNGRSPRVREARREGRLRQLKSSRGQGVGQEGDDDGELAGYEEGQVYVAGSR